MRRLRVFVDSNVLLDVLLAREPFVRDSAGIWAYAEQDRFEGLVSAVTFTTIFYIIRRAHSRDHAMTALRLLESVFTPVGCDAGVVRQAIEANLKDFQDATQYFSARDARADIIVTRNLPHFPADEIPVMSPAAFLEANRFN